MHGKRYTEEQYRQKYNSSVFGIVLAVLVEAGVFGLCTIKTFTYLDPPPPEKTFIEAPDLVEQEAPVIKRKKGPKPAAEQVNQEKKVELVQKSEAPHKGTKPNVAKAATVGPKGDVEVPEPPREEPINTNALMPSMDNFDQKDTLAAQVAKEVSDALAQGRPDGNVTKGKTTGEPTAHVKGFVVDGVLGAPNYKGQKDGTIVITIYLREDGSVITNDPIFAPALDPDKSTTTDSELVRLAIEKAGQAHFRVSPNYTPGKYNKGTITYIFSIVGH